MGDHYIPQYYLNGFSSPKDENIWVYEKGNSKVFCSKSKSIANENNYYTSEVEKYLANQIESPANAVINKIRERQSISQDDKRKLAIYMTVMLNRVPQSKIRMKKLFPNTIASLRAQYKKEASKAIAEKPSKADFVKKRLTQIMDIFERCSKEIPKDIWLTLISAKNSPNIMEHIYKMTWHFMTFDDSPVFITCDNPIFYFQSIGIGKPESEITFPISSNIILWANWRKDLSKGYSKIKYQGIFKEINRRTAINATRYVYHSKKENWIQDFINKNHQLRRLV